MTSATQYQTGSATHNRWIAVAVLLLSLAMSLIDNTVVNIALPSIREGLKASDSAISWTVSGYLLAYALTLLPGGWLGDRFGHKKVFLTGTLFYVLTGIGAALVSTDTHLVIFRLLHGVSGGLMIPPIAALIQAMFSGQARARAFGLYGFAIAAGAIVGPVVGGWLVEAVGMKDGWRWALTYGLSLGALAVALGLPLIPEIRDEEGGKRQFDLIGAVLMSLSILGFIMPINQMTEGQVPWWTVVSVPAALGLLAAFILWERYLERNDASPLLPLSLFKSVPFSFGLVSCIPAFASFTGSIYIAFSVIWQSGRGEGPLAAALVMLPHSIGTAVGPLISDWLIQRIGHWSLPLTNLCLFAGYLIAYLMLLHDPQVSALALLVPTSIAGFGSGAFVSLNMASTFSSVPSQYAGSAVGILVVFQRIGAALGAALVIMLISQPGPAGPDDFGAATMLHTGTNSVLLCTLMAGAALLLSIAETLFGRTSLADEPIKEDVEKQATAL